MARMNHEAGQDVQQNVLDALEAALIRAEVDFTSGEKPDYGLTQRLTGALEQISTLSQKASTGFTNIVTCLAIKIARPDVDIRYHQVQIQGQTERGANFNFRGLSPSLTAQTPFS